MTGVTLYLVRHGEADSNAAGILSSYPEVPGRTVRHLTARGMAEVQETADSLREEGIDVIISSPLTRAVETATIIGEAVGVPVWQDIRLRETDFGQFNTLPMDKFFQVYSSPEKRIHTDGSDGVESFEDMRARVTNLLNEVAREFPGKKVVLVSHGDALEQIHGVITSEDVTASALGWSPKTGTYLKMVWQGTSAI